MATTTSNFGWPIPQSTDLVKDGATAMASLGSGIDTSLVDLKGGTTGQILSKASNTDLDYAWVTPNPGDITGVTAGTGLTGGGTSGDVTLTNTVATAFDAKGDLVIGTGADTFAKLTVGANNTIPIADSAETTGIKWGGAWQDWTPSLTNLTVGNGTLVTRYRQVGKEIDFEIRFTMGSTSSIGSTPQISMPVSPKQSSLAAFPIQILDSGTTNYIGFTDCFSDKFYLTVGLANATYLQFSYFSATVPMTWATNDAFMIRGSYEAA